MLVREGGIFGVGVKMKLEGSAMISVFTLDAWLRFSFFGFFLFFVLCVCVCVGGGGEQISAYSHAGRISQM